MTKDATPKTPAQAAIGFGAHNHAKCKAAALRSAEALCDAGGLKLTPVRRRTLEILAEAHQALGAYDVLERLAAEGLGDKPPVAYRALGFLVENGLAHRIERLNAYVACAHPGAEHNAAFMICRKCTRVAEAEPQGLLANTAGAAGFQIESLVIEAEGLCSDCADTAEAQP